MGKNKKQFMPAKYAGMINILSLAIWGGGFQNRQKLRACIAIMAGQSEAKWGGGFQNVKKLRARLIKISVFQRPYVFSTGFIKWWRMCQGDQGRALGALITAPKHPHHMFSARF